MKIAATICMLALTICMQGQKTIARAYVGIANTAKNPAADWIIIEKDNLTG